MARALQSHSYSVQAMGSRCEFHFYAAGNELEVFHTLQERLQVIEQKYSRYRADSMTSQINAAAGSGRAVTIDKETFGLLHYAQALFEQSSGLFDITSGILRKAWNFHSGQLPHAQLLEQQLRLIGWATVDWNESSISLPEEGMEIDFGGFVKEYAADQLAGLMASLGVCHGIVNLGGDIVVIGPHPDGRPWVVGIQHPRQPGKAIVKVPLMSGAIATSGDYERFMMVDGVRYCHILNPQTGWPIQSRYAGISVLANQCLLAGSFSTIAMLKSELEPQWLADAGVKFVMVDQQMAIQSNLPTPG